MFQGTIEPPVRSILQTQFRRWNVPELWVACSGKFTIERSLHSMATMHGNDVSVYTNTIGALLAGNPVELELTDETREWLPWLQDYMNSDIAKVATMMLADGLFTALDRADRNAYYQRQVEGYHRQWERLHAGTVAKLEKVDVRLASYHALDCREYLEDVVPQGAPVVSFPPFDVGGYEKMFAPLDHHFIHPKVEYDILDEEGIEDTLRLIMDRKHWLFATNTRREEFEDNLIGVVQTAQLRRPNYIYASEHQSRLVKPRLPLKVVNGPRLGPGDRIGDSLTLARIGRYEFDYIRSQYLDPKIKLGRASAPCVVLSEGRILGVIAASDSDWVLDEIYLTSDFAVDSSDYPKLSKLVAMCARTVEYQQLMESMFSRKFRRLSTTAFTRRPVSMKYRGVLDLSKREDSEDPNFNYQLMYEGEIGSYTLDEALAEWRRKGWGHTTGEKENGK